MVEEVHTHFPRAEVLVVNDGSTDLTSEIAKLREAVVLGLHYNLGIGGAMQAGYRYAFEKGYDIAVWVNGGSEFYLDFEEEC